MRELPLYNNEWVKENITVKYETDNNIHKYIKIQFPKLLLFNDFSSIYLYKPYITSKSRLINKSNLLIFKDIITHELFKFNITEGNICILFKDIVDAIWRNDIIHKEFFHKKEDVTGFIEIDPYNSRYIPNYNNGLPKPKLSEVKKYLNEKLDMNLLSNSSQRILAEYAAGCVYPKSFNRFAIDLIKNDNNYIDYNTFIEKLHMYKKYVNSYNLTERLDDHLDFITVKYLINKHKKFSGHYDINFIKSEENNKSRNSFNTIDLEIRMLSGYDDNLKYLKENIRDIKLTLKDIMEINPKTKDYSKFLKMYSLILTRDNVLLARFCFKDGLEELCK